MTAPPQQQLTPGDHQYFEWSTSKQQTNLIHPLMTQTHRKNYYQQLDDNQLKQNKTTITSPLTLSPTSHIKKKQKINSLGSSSSTFDTNDQQNQSQTCYPFQAELTQKIDIECGGGGSSNNVNNNCNNINGINQTNHTPTHHFTLSTVINVSVNSQTQKSLDIVPSSSSSQSQSQYPLKSYDQTNFHVHSSSSSSLSTLIPSTELNLSLYLKDIDLTTFDSFILPSCPNPQDYLTVDGLLTFLMSDKNLSKQQIHNYPQTQYNRYPYQQHQMSQYYNYPQQNLTSSCVSSTSMETGNISYYRQSSLPQQMTKYYSTTTTSTPSFR